MRYSKQHKAETRTRVLAAAARAIRAKGPDGVAVAGIMAEVGLTHGGFYAHFPSKDALVEAALETMFEGARERSEPILGDGDPRVVLRTYLDFYLSARHRDARDRGCPLPALSGDFARDGGAGRERFGAGVAGLTGRLTKVLARMDIADPEIAAAAMLAELVGAVALARAVADPAQSDAILSRVRTSVIQRYGLEPLQ